MKIDVSLSVHDGGAILWAYWLSLAIVCFGVVAIGSPGLFIAVGLALFAHPLTVGPLAIRYRRFGLVLFAGVGLISCSVVGAVVAWLTPHCHWRDGLIAGAVSNLIASLILWGLRSKLPWNE